MNEYLSVDIFVAYKLLVFVKNDKFDSLLFLIKGFLLFIGLLCFSINYYMLN